MSITKAVQLHNPYALQYNDSDSKVAIPIDASKTCRSRTTEFWLYGTQDLWTNNDNVITWQSTSPASNTISNILHIWGNGAIYHDVSYGEQYVGFASGSSEYMTIPVYSPGAGSFTIEMIVRITSTTNWARVMSADNSSSTGSFKFQLHSDDARLNFKIYDDIGGNAEINSTTDLQDSCWHHIAIVVDRTNDTLDMYVDGTKDATTVDLDASAEFDDVTISGAWEIAKQVGGASYCDLEMAEFRLWNDVRTATEIEDNAFAFVTPAQASLMRYYVFENGSGATVSDYGFLSAGPGGGNATLVNTPTWGEFTTRQTFTVTDYEDILGWHHWAFRYHASLGTGRIYLDGELLDEESSWYTFGRKASSGLLYINSTMTDAKMSEFRLWNDSRGAAEIQDNMFAELVGTESNLIVYYDYSDKSGATLTDKTSNSYDGTITSANWVAGFPNQGGGWEDISSDVMINKAFSHSQGINGKSPTALVASPGKFTFYLDNRNKNSAGLAGYYSPDHTNIRDGFIQGAGVRVKYDSTYYWRGRIHDITPDPSPYKAYTKVVCYDWMKDAQSQKFKTTVVATDQRLDQVLTTLKDLLPLAKQPASTDFATCKSTFPYAFHSERDEKSTVLSVCQKGAQSELGKIYVNHQDGGGQQLVCESRHHAVDETTVQHDFDDNVVKVSPSYPFDLIKTVIFTNAHPGKFDTGDVVLGQIQKSFQVPPGETRSPTIYFRDPDGNSRISALSLAARVSGTDYIANADEDGGGANRTSDLTVTVSTEDDGTELISGNSITLDCANGGSSLFWVTTLQQKGKGIYQFDPLTYKAVATEAYLTAKGEHILRYDLPYEDDYNEAVSFGDYLLSVWKDPICQINGLTYYPEENSTLTTAFKAIDIGHRVTVNFTQLGIDEDYFVSKTSVTLDKGKLKCSYNLATAGSSVYMQLDDAIYAKLDESECKLAF